MSELNSNLITENEALKKYIEQLRNDHINYIKYTNEKIERQKLEISRLRKIILKGCELDNFINKRG